MELLDFIGFYRIIRFYQIIGLLNSIRLMDFHHIFSLIIAIIKWPKKIWLRALLSTWLVNGHQWHKFFRHILSDWTSSDSSLWAVRSAHVESLTWTKKAIWWLLRFWGRAIFCQNIPLVWPFGSPRGNDGKTHKSHSHLNRIFKA